MSPQQLFSIANAVALLAWIMLTALPGRSWLTKTITTKLVPSFFAVLYTVIFVSLFGRSPGGFSTLASVGTLFSNAWLLLAGWVLYIWPLIFWLAHGRQKTRPSAVSRIGWLFHASR